MPSRKGPRPNKGAPRTRFVRKEARKPAVYPKKEQSIPDAEIVRALVVVPLHNIIEDPLMDVKVDPNNHKRFYISTTTAVSLSQLNSLLVRTLAKNVHTLGRDNDLVIVLDLK